MSTRIGLVMSLALLGLALTALPSPASTASAAALHTCALTPKEEQHFGPTYVTSVKVHGIGCAAGKAVVKSFQTCRRAHGGVKGRCPHSVSVRGFHCTENRSTIPSQFTSKVTCASGSRRVVHTYTQNT
ncbi:MAG: hypothetical protein JWM71_771 [Solirubrobacteraceae bacterium]|nr:hypothetical protein [Solirubrobacteraceae bacterium]